MKSLIQKAIDATPYWVAHAVIALLIAAVIWPFFGIYIGLLVGAGFYSLRELYQWKILKLPFDWPGLISPVVACAVVAIAVTII